MPAAVLQRLLRGVSAAAALADMPGGPPPPPALVLPSGRDGDGGGGGGWLGQGPRAVLQGADQEVEARILDGEPAPESEWGFMVALVSRVDNSTVLCGGALLDNMTVLTGATAGGRRLQLPRRNTCPAAPARLHTTPPLCSWPPCMPKHIAWLS